MAAGHDARMVAVQGSSKRWNHIPHNGLVIGLVGGITILSGLEIADGGEPNLDIHFLRSSKALSISKTEETPDLGLKCLVRSEKRSSGEGIYSYRCFSEYVHNLGGLCVFMRTSRAGFKAHVCTYATVEAELTPRL